MQCVHILRYDGHVIISLHLSQQLVAFTWLHILVFHAQHVIEVIDVIRISLPPLMRGNALYGIVVPQTSCITECAQAALYRHSCAGQYHNLLFHIAVFVIPTPSRPAREGEVVMLYHKCKVNIFS